MDDHMTDDLRAKLAEFIKDNPDAVAKDVERVAVVDGYTALDKMRSNFEHFLDRVPLPMLMQPSIIAAITMNARCLAELEVILRDGIVNFKQEAVDERAREILNDTMHLPFDKLT